MFSFLKKSGTPVHTDNIWKTRQACLKGMLTEALHILSKSGKPVIISWFDDRHQSLLDYLDQFKVPYTLMDEYFELSDEKNIFILNAGLVARSRYVDSFKAKQKTIFADGHYPLINYEREILEKLCGTDPENQVSFCMSLEDPLLKSFGSENIIALLEKLGLDDNEKLDHPMIRKAIQRTREKISSAVISEIRTQNEGEWFMKNVKCS